MTHMNIKNVPDGMPHACDTCTGCTRIRLCGGLANVEANDHLHPPETGKLQMKYWFSMVGTSQLAAAAGTSPGFVYHPRGGCIVPRGANSRHPPPREGSFGPRCRPTMPMFKSKIS